MKDIVDSKDSNPGFLIPANPANTKAEREKYLAARGTTFSLHTAILIASLYLTIMQKNPKPENYFLYLTHDNLFFNWVMEAVMLYKTIAFLCSHQIGDTSRRIEETANEAAVLRDTTMTLTLMVTLLYWSTDRSGDLRIQSLFHGLPAALLIAEKVGFKDDYMPDTGSLMRDFTSWRFLTPLFGGLFYLALEAGTTFAGVTNEEGDPLYAVLDWKHDLSKAVIFSAIGETLFAAIPAIHYGFRRMKDRLCSSGPSLENLPLEEPRHKGCASLLSSWCCKFAPSRLRGKHTIDVEEAPYKELRHTVSSP